MNDEITDSLESDENLVKFIRLNNGEDLVAEVTAFEKEDSKERVFCLHDPMKVVYTVGGPVPGMIQIALIQWVFPRLSNDQEFYIFEKDILTMADASTDVTDYYYRVLDQYGEPDSKPSASDVPSDFHDTSPEDGIQFLKDLINQVSGNTKPTLH